MDIDLWKNNALDALKNNGPLVKSLNWNAGTYLWLSGQSQTLQDGINQAQSSIVSGSAEEVLSTLIKWRDTFD